MPSETTYFFYDLETSGRDPRRHRIMQFAGRRTNLALEPIGEPVNWLVRLADDVLPEPQAICITGLTPQLVQDGLTEAEFVRRLHETICLPGTIMVGFNNVRFDDEYLRYTAYRNFYDAYAWSYKDGRGRWDVLDVARLTRALRPDGIAWPADANGDPINTLVELARANHLDHFKAHDALSDVDALVGVARLIKGAQPKLWDYALSLRRKDAVAAVIKPDRPEPFVYTSGMYGREHDFTTIAAVIGEDRPGCYYVYDLRVDPAPFLQLSPAQARQQLFTKRDELAGQGLARIPVKTLSTNKCPAVAPLGTLTPEAAGRLGLDMAAVRRHWQTVQASGLAALVAAAYRQQEPYPPAADADAALYDGFVRDEAACAAVRSTPEHALAGLAPNFSDARLTELFVRYKARNYPDTLSAADRQHWEAYRSQRIMADIEAWSHELQDCYAQTGAAGQSLLTDLQLWAESIYPADI